MTESFPRAVRGQRRRSARFLVRIGRRTLAELLYLLTAPVIAVAGLVLVLGGVGVGTIALLVPGGSRVASDALAPARWFAGLERWRIGKVRPLAFGPEGTGSAGGTRSAGLRGAGLEGAGREGAGREGAAREGAHRRRRAGETATPDPELWLNVTHAVVVLPVALVTSVLTAVWLGIGVAFTSFPVRNHYVAGSLAPTKLNLGTGQTHIDLSLGLTVPSHRLAFVLTVGPLMLLTLPLVTRAFTAAQAGLGQALLSDASALYRKIAGLEEERDTARAQTVAAVTAEATALRRLERDIHDGPQQRLVRLAMELGRAQRHLDTRPEAVREALSDAIAQAQEALDELRALSRGIAPPILVDRGLGEALTALAARSTVPAELDAEHLDRRLEPAVETAAYFVVAEALTNVAKHSRAGRCAIGLRRAEGTLRVWVTDDGVGGAALAKGHGLRGLDDRLHAVGGRLRLHSPHGGPTTIAAELPCG
jgi:signal transduction histidine kinase